MTGLANRIVNRFSDLTVGTVIVLVHVALANRQGGARTTPTTRTERVE